MIRQSFNAGWTVGKNRKVYDLPPAESPQPVMLPHDAMITQPRDPGVVSGNKKGFFPDKTYAYVKRFHVPLFWKEKRIFLEFEGIYGNAMIYLNGDFAGQRPYGYSNFYIKADPYLKYGEENEIKVVVKSHDDSRWYTGTGIYRNVNLIVANMAHIAPDGVRITTPDITGERAVVSVAITVANEGCHPRTVTIVSKVLDADGKVVASGRAPLTIFAGETAVLRQRLYVKRPNLWDVDTPYLYTLKSLVLDGEEILDEEINTFGIRNLSLDPENGLMINGKTVKLRGACIHHDNGVIGAAAIDRAEERKIEILKKAGFNAIRSAHNPVSRAMLNACDRLGMLVMDECFDVWTVNKSDFDYALHFSKWWEQDVEAMVNKDFNHPSVILYSIGNEIPETGSPHGAAWGRKIAEKIRSLDSTRFITNSINGFLVAIESLMNAGKTEELNAVMANAGEAMKRGQESELVAKLLEESYAVVDVAGYNYADTRYVMDRERFPNRIIVGSETYPRDIANNWKLVMENSHVIGDFTWTGWDYLGEAGIGKPYREQGDIGITGGYPWMIAYCGDINIIGDRRPASYYREIVFGLRKDPYIAVQRPWQYGRPTANNPWSWSDTVSSWSWEGFEGKPVHVEVYADADEVELVLNGTSVGRSSAGPRHAFKAEFDIVYEPGELTAVAYTGGEESGRMTLRTAGPGVRLKAEADRSRIRADDRDLAFISISLTDDAGILKPMADRKVTVTVEGSGILLGLGSANPKTEESFCDNEHTTFDGRALAVIRPTGAGKIRVCVMAEGCAPQTVEILAES